MTNPALAVKKKKRNLKDIYTTILPSRKSSKGKENPLF